MARVLRFIGNCRQIIWNPLDGALERLQIIWRRRQIIWVGRDGAARGRGERLRGRREACLDGPDVLGRERNDLPARQGDAPVAPGAARGPGKPGVGRRGPGGRWSPATPGWKCRRPARRPEHQITRANRDGTGTIMVRIRQGVGCAWNGAGIASWGFDCPRVDRPTSPHPGFARFPGHTRGYGSVALTGWRHPSARRRPRGRGRPFPRQELRRDRPWDG